MVAIPDYPRSHSVGSAKSSQSAMELSGISWQTYESLLADLSDHRLRLTYHHGYLEIMTPSPEQESYKKVLGRFVETLAEELEIQIAPLGSTTFRRLESVGAEPDECFYVSNIAAVRGKKRFEVGQIPPPDLVVEIDITSSSQKRLEVYQELAIPEIWSYDGSRLQIYQLISGEYRVVPRSMVFPTIPVVEIEPFLAQTMETDYLTLIRSFRQWVRSLLSV
jgi:Uma2 family endonuclease